MVRIVLPLGPLAPLGDQGSSSWCVNPLALCTEIYWCPFPPKSSVFSLAQGACLTLALFGRQLKEALGIASQHRSLFRG